MFKGAIARNKTALTWIAKAFLIKLLLFAFFSWCFHQYWPSRLNLNYFFNASGDTSGYYDPCESFVQGNGYNSYCRMPGLLPVYAILRFVLSVTWTKTLIIFLQFIVSTISVYALARVAQYTFKSERIFRITFYLYAISSFVSIWDHVGYSDSFALSFLIFSLFYLFKYKEQAKLKYLLLSACFITWSVFFRPVHGILLPLIALLFLVDLKNILKSIRQLVAYGIPFVLCIAFWTNHNYKLSGRFILLQGPMEECFPGITKEMLSIRELIMAWGGDIQPWAAGSAGQWFFDRKELKKGSPLPESGFETTAYNADSLVKLRNAYYTTQIDSLPDAQRNAYSLYVINNSKLYVDAYKKEKAFRFYFLSRMRILKDLLFRKRLDDLPLPSVNNMNIVQKGVKLFYYLLLLAVNVLGTIGALMALRRRKYLGLISLVLIFFFAFVLRFVEQRYLAPVYVINVIFLAYLIDLLWQKIRKKKDSRAEIN